MRGSLALGRAPVSLQPCRAQRQCREQVSCLGGQGVHVLVHVYLCVCMYVLPVHMPLYVHACTRDL